MQETIKIPEDHFAACAALSPPMAIAGNAAANTVDLLDLSGQNLSPDPLPSGFEPRGIVALTFSILAGLIGVGVIAWYGLGEMTNIEKDRQVDHVVHIQEDRGIAKTESVTGSTGAPDAGVGARDTIETAR